MMSDFYGITSSVSCIICYGTNGILLRSSDLGNTWEQLPFSHDTVTVLKIININGEFWGITNNGNIIHSLAEGKYWSLTGTSHNLYDFQFYKDQMYALSDSMIICYDKNATEVEKIEFKLKIKPTELGIFNGYFILPADTGLVYVQNIKDKSDKSYMDFKNSGQCENCKIPNNFQCGNSAFFVSSGDNILESSSNIRQWVIMAKNFGLFRVNNNSIFTLAQKIFYPQYMLTTPSLSKYENGGYTTITSDIVRRYVINQPFSDFKFINDSLIVAVGSNKTIYKSSNKGISWELISNKSSTFLTSWYNKDFGVTFKEKGLVFTTRNGGITWVPQKFTDTTIQKFQYGNYAYAGSDGRCMIYYPDVNVMNHKNIMISKNYGETFVQLFNDSLYSNWNPVDDITTDNGNVHIYYSYGDEYYQLSQVIVLDSNFQFIKRQLMFDSLVILPNTIKKINNYYESFAVYHYPSKNPYIDSCVLYTIKSDDCLNWNKEHLCRIQGNVRYVLRLNDFEYLLSFSKDTTIIDTVTKYGLIIGKYFIINYNSKTHEQDTLLSSFRYPLQKLLNYNGKIYNFGWKSVFTSDFSNLSRFSWDSINIKPYESIFFLKQFDNVLYGGASFGSKKNIIKYILPTQPNGIIDQTEIRTQVYAYPPYPLPASDIVRCKIYWDLRYDIKNSKITVYDTFGNIIPTFDEIYIKPILDYSGEIIWDCHNVPNGIYLIVFNHGDAKKAISVVISR